MLARMGGDGGRVGGGGGAGLFSGLFIVDSLVVMKDVDGVSGIASSTTKCFSKYVVHVATISVLFAIRLRTFMLVHT